MPNLAPIGLPEDPFYQECLCIERPYTWTNSVCPSLASENKTNLLTRQALGNNKQGSHAPASAIPWNRVRP